jgi:amidase
MLKNREISVIELTQEYLRRIKLYDQGTDKLNSVLEINPDALNIAKGLDDHQTKYTSPLYGVPILLKDNIDTGDKMHTSAGSLALANSTPSSDAKIVKTLRQRGALILGKTNMTEFANHMTKGMKAGYSSRGGIVLSPYNKDISPSGSSTGSAVAVSSNFCTVSIGTDTSGSIVEPSITNGIVGFRPSIGTLSQQGIIPISFTMDTAGPMTRTVMDSIILFTELTDAQMIIGESTIKGMLIGLDQSSFNNMTEEEMKKADIIIRTLEKSGAEIKRIQLPQIPTKCLKDIQLYEFKYSINEYLATLPKEFKIRSLKDIIKFNALNLETTLRYGQTLLLRAEENTKGDLSEENYKQLLTEREKVKNEIIRLLDDLDICIFFKKNLLFQYIGLPIITIPHGLYNNGMPYGIHLSGLKDNGLLKCANIIEKAVGYRVIPPL